MPPWRREAPVPPMSPEFAIEGGLPLALARGASVAALAAAFGGVLYARLLAPPGLQPHVARALHRFAALALGAAILGAVLWFAAQTQDMAGSLSVHAFGLVLGTVFGHLVAARLALLVLALLAWPRVPMLSVILASLAMALQAGHSHAAAMDGVSPLLAVATLHVLAAGAWLGGLLPLFLVISGEEPPVGGRAARRFSLMGIGCVAVLLATATIQGWVLLGGLPGIVGTAYGWMALLKAALFAVLIGFALRNRLSLTPALTARPPGSGRRFGRAILLETMIGLLVILAAGVLTELPPGMHTQRLWPFPVRLSLEAVREDPDFMREAIEAGLVLGSAVLVLLVVAATLLRRQRTRRGMALRGGAAAAALAAGVLAAPHLDLLFVPAYPTEYFRSPTGFSAESIVQGAALFPPHCAMCHGADGRGDGPAAKSLSVPPANLTAAHLFMHKDGELFWWLSNGIDAPDGSPAMPGFAAALSDGERWALIDYIRAHNAGLTVSADGHWDRVITAPAFDATCADGQTRTLSAFAGQVVRLVVDAPAQAMPGVTTIVTQDRAQPGPGLCVARDDMVGHAYAIAAGLRGDAAGAVFLIDPEGLLRRVWKPGETADGLIQAVADIRAHKAVSALASGATMKMDGMDMPGMGGMDMGNMNMSPRPASGAPAMGGGKMDGMKMDGMKMDGMKMDGMKM